jgi:hypothetical protein
MCVQTQPSQTHLYDLHSSLHIPAPVQHMQQVLGDGAADEQRAAAKGVCRSAGRGEAQGGGRGEARKEWQLGWGMGCRQAGGTGRKHTAARRERTHTSWVTSMHSMGAAPTCDVLLQAQPSNHERRGHVEHQAAAALAVVVLKLQDDCWAGLGGLGSGARWWVGVVKGEQAVAGR